MTSKEGKFLSQNIDLYMCQKEILFSIFSIFTAKVTLIFAWLFLYF